MQTSKGIMNGYYYFTMHQGKHTIIYRNADHSLHDVLRGPGYCKISQKRHTQKLAHEMHHVYNMRHERSLDYRKGL